MKREGGSYHVGEDGRAVLVERTRRADDPQPGPLPKGEPVAPRREAAKKAKE